MTSLLAIQLTNYLFTKLQYSNNVTLSANMNLSTHIISSRHVDAGMADRWGDSRLYIGYGAYAPTKSIGFY